MFSSRFNNPWWGPWTDPANLQAFQALTTPISNNAFGGSTPDSAFGATTSDVWPPPTAERPLTEEEASADRTTVSNGDDANASWLTPARPLQTFRSIPGLHLFRPEPAPGLHLFQPDPEPGLHSFRPDPDAVSDDVEPAIAPPPFFHPEARHDEPLSQARDPLFSDGGPELREIAPIGTASSLAFREAEVPAPSAPPYEAAFGALPPTPRVQEALDQIARIYGVDYFDRRDLHSDNLLRGPVFREADAVVGDTFDPQYIVPVGPPTGGGPPRPPAGGGAPRPPAAGGPTRPLPPTPVPDKQRQGPSTRGKGDNKGPPLDDDTPGPGTPPSTPPGGQGGRPSGTGAPPDPAGAAAAAERHGIFAESNPDIGSREAADQIARIARGEAPDFEYDKSNGQQTGVGVYVDPSLPEPVAGWKHNPPAVHLRLGFMGELRLANRIARALKGEVVVSYGMPAGRQGPDVISVGPDGTIRVWDSKWRTRTMRITSGAHEKEQSLALAATEVERQVKAAITAGRLTPEAAAKAAENAAKGNFFVITVGTGNAHGGMVTAVEGRKFVLDPRKK